MSDHSEAMANRVLRQRSKVEDDVSAWAVMGRNEREEGGPAGEREGRGGNQGWADGRQKHNGLRPREQREKKGLITFRKI